MWLNSFQILVTSSDAEHCPLSGVGSRVIVNVTAFESLAAQPVTKTFPMAPETEVVLPSAGFNTNTSTEPGCAMSAALIGTTN